MSTSPQTQQNQPVSLDARTNSPQNILRLQRTIGNRAVSKMLRKPVMIQRTFEDGATFVDGLHLDAPDAQITEMGRLMTAYNTYLDIGEKQVTDYQAAAKTLKDLDSVIFRWLDAKNGAHEKLEDIPHFDKIDAVRKQAAKEHEDFVAEASTKEGILPFDLTGVPRAQAMKMIILWNKIKNGTSKIKLVGDPAHKKKIYSWIVKLLETQTGRTLLGYLDAGDPAELMSNIYIGQTKDQLPDGVEDQAKTNGRELEDRGVSEAQPLGNSQEVRGPVDLDGTEDPEDYPVVARPEDFRDALVAGKEGAILNGQKYIFNSQNKSGVGAFVTAEEGESKNESAQHHQILTPGWVTMGHELGHAAHMRGGATNMMAPQIMEGLTGKNLEELNMIWQNSEELLTIQNWENGIRSDVGLTNRASHIPYTAGKKVERYFTIYNDMKTVYPNPYYFQIADLGTFKADLTRAFNSKDANVNLEKNEVFQGLRDRWNVLRTRFTIEDVKAVQRNELLPIYNKLTTKYAQKKGEYDGKIKLFMKGAKKREWATHKQNYLRYNDNYLNHLDDHLGAARTFSDFKDGMDQVQYNIGRMTF